MAEMEAGSLPRIDGRRDGEPGLTLRDIIRGRNAKTY